jgi:hypothetical protein
VIRVAAKVAQRAVADGKGRDFTAESWQHLKHQIDARWKIQYNSPYEIVYKDKDGDDINIDCEDDFRFALQYVGDNCSPSLQITTAIPTSPFVDPL